MMLPTELEWKRVGWMKWRSISLAYVIDSYL